MPVRIRRSSQTVSVTTAATRVLQVDPNRLTCNITNLGSARVSQIDNPSQPEASGYPIASGSFINYKLSDGDDVSGSFIFKSVSGTNILRIQESFKEELSY
ncbi:MAG: hypothetical protein JKY75_00545 [Erythrobacter sp.]|jgi:hypothetical protein|nr:hypothetical protein [Erythrobacter sp.]